MADARPFLVTDSSGAPVLGAAAGMVLTYVDKAGAAQASPGITELGGGLYQVLPTDADETAGRVAYVDCGAGNEPRRITLAIHKTDNSNQFFAFHAEDTAGALWTGAAPTFASYTDKAGGARTAPTLTAIAAAYLWVATPSAADVTADSAGLVLVGGLPWVQLATEPVASGTTSALTVVTATYPASSPGLSHVLDFVTRAQARALGQYRTASKFMALLGELGGIVQGLEDAVWGLIDMTAVSTATGIWLDRLGAVVGEERGGEADALYRTIIQARIIALRSSGTVENIIAALVPILVATEGAGYTLGVVQFAPAGLELSLGPSGAAFNSGTLIQRLGRIIKAARAAGVGVSVLYPCGPDDHNFTFATSAAPEADIDFGFSNTSAPTTGGWFTGVVRA
jgi:hypothetical protein